MKKLLVLMFTILMASSVLAYTPDGQLDDWGVNLTAAFMGADLAWYPYSTTADFSIEDNIHPDNSGCDWTGYCEHGYHTQAEPKVRGYNEPVGGERSDIEALYFDDDSGYGYFAAVISMPPEGYTDAWGRHYDPGHFALDLDNDPNTGEYGFEYGIVTYGPNAGQVCYMPDWHLPAESIGFIENAPSTLTCDGASSVVKGMAQIAYVDSGVSDHGVENFVIEAKVPRSMLGNPSKSQLSTLRTALTCGNDVVVIDSYEWDFDIPEFSTIGAGLVLLGAALYVKRRRK